MEFRELAVPGAWEMTPRRHGDARGVFLEWFRQSAFVDAVGHEFRPEQANASVSAAGVLRGIHFADVPPSQSKYVTCPQGAVLDVVVDIRVGSPTFGAWDTVLLDDVDRRAVYVSEGLGHAFVSLEDGSTVMYLCSESYAPTREHGIHPLSQELAIEWPTTDRAGRPMTFQLSDKDAAAPTFREAAEQGLLPTYAAATAFTAALRQG